MNGNFSIMPNDILEKLIKTTGGRAAVLFWIYRFTLGFHLPMLSQNNSAIGRATGMARNSVRRIINSLVDEKILTRNGKLIGFTPVVQNVANSGVEHPVDTPEHIVAIDGANGSQQGVQDVPPLKKERKDRKKLLKKLWAKRFHDTFWPAYPKRVGKDPAFKSWMKLHPSGKTLRMIMGPLKLQVQGWGDARFIPYPGTWLNQKRWEDEVETHLTVVDPTLEIIRKELES